MAQSSVYRDHGYMVPGSMGILRFEFLKCLLFEKPAWDCPLKCLSSGKGVRQYFLVSKF